MNFERLQLGRSAQRIIRYHTQPTNETQTVGAHTFGVLLLLVELTDNNVSLALMKAALFHDMAESECGDPPSPALRKYPDLHSAIKKAEADIEAYYSLNITLSDEEKRLLKLADRLECAMFSMEDYERGNKNGGRMVGRVLRSIAQDGLLTAQNERLLFEHIAGWMDKYGITW